jgi:CRP-like cAMP-binding protein
VEPQVDRLRAVPLFSELSDDELERLAAWFTVRHEDEGTRITPEGASGYVFFVIDQGTVDVIRDAGVIASLGPGDYFGEMAILGDGRRVADVIATSPVTLFAMFGTAFRELDAGMPSVAETLRATLEVRRSVP